MNSKVLKPVIIFFCLISIINCYGQKDDTQIKRSDLHKNIFYGTFATRFIYYASLEGSYERMFFENQNLSFSTFWVRVGFGGFTFPIEEGDGGPYYVAALGTMTGAKSSHFEIQAGLSLIYNKSQYEMRHSDYLDFISYNNNASSYYNEPVKKDYYFLRFAGSIGYRYQEPGNSIFFRTGIKYPGALYISLGVCF